MSADKEYKPVPVEAAQTIADQYGKSIVIVYSWDAQYGLLHTTTYGLGPQNKAWAAAGGEIGAKALGAVTELSLYSEDYRLKVAKDLYTAMKEVAFEARSGGVYAEHNIKRIAEKAMETAEEFLGK